MPRRNRMFLAILCRTSQPHFLLSKQKKAIQHLSVWSRISDGTWTLITGPPTAPGCAFQLPNGSSE